MMRRVTARLFGWFGAGAATFVGSVVAFLLLAMMDGGARPLDTLGLNTALSDDGPVIAYRRPPAPARTTPQPRPLTPTAAGAILGRSEADVVARLGRPSREHLAEPAKVLHYDRPGCRLEVHLFPDYRRGQLYALDVLDIGGSHDCLG